ncbi:MAG TPA: DUF5706 domain-containing protein, partial [Chitinophagaceae bacterium]|nr:DUF5706 domain-containing protein [Chitinophagaceae bacterium]
QKKGWLQQGFWGNERNNAFVLIFFKFIKSYLYRMGENNQQLLKEAKNAVSELFNNKVSESVKFHTLKHTEEVVAASQKMADFYQIPPEDYLALSTAAWFHDTGFSGGQAKDHESVSIQIATDFLQKQGATQDFIEKVIGCINATRMPQNPRSIIEMIICDADLSHLGSENFKEKSRLLRDELREFGEEEISKNEWRYNNIAFLEAHKYFTSYGQKNLQPIKEKYLAKLKEKTTAMAKADKKNKEKALSQADSIPEEPKKAKDSKKNQTERGISTVFRIMAQNQNNLSQMADSKANIMVSVNSIILTIVISTLFTKLDSNSNLQIPVIMLVVVCVTAIVFSILATRPNVTHGTFTEDDIHNKRTNLLFFGNFYKMGLQDYSWAMQEMLDDRDYLYNSIVKDNYFLGVVLAKKYRYLRIAYNIFMYGLILTMIAFAIAFAIPEAGEVYRAG